jgi:hypothetical protein
MLFQDIRLGSRDFYLLLLAQVTSLASLWPPASLASLLPPASRWLLLSLHSIIHTNPNYKELMSLLRNVGVTRILLHRLRLALGWNTAHPFGTREAIERTVYYACADSLAEIMGTLCVFGKRSIDTHIDHIERHYRTEVSEHKHDNVHAITHTHTDTIHAHTHFIPQRSGRGRDDYVGLCWL